MATTGFHEVLAKRLEKVKIRIQSRCREMDNTLKREQSDGKVTSKLPLDCKGFTKMTRKRISSKDAEKVHEFKSNNNTRTVKNITERLRRLQNN